MNRSQLINILWLKNRIKQKKISNGQSMPSKTNCPGSQRGSNLPAWFRLIQTSFSIQSPCETLKTVQPYSCLPGPSFISNARSPLADR